MAELYTGALAVCGMASLLMALYVLLKRRMPGSKTGGYLVLLSSLWSTAYLHQLMFPYSEDIIRGFLIKSGVSYIFPFLFVIYLHRYFEFKVPKYVPFTLLIIPSIFSVAQLLPRLRPYLIHDLIIYNQNQVAPKYTLLGLTPIFLTYLLGLILYGYFIKTLISKPSILKARVIAFLCAASIFFITYTFDLFLLDRLRYELTPPIINVLCVGVAMFSTERLYKKDVLSTVFSNMVEEIGDLIIVTDSLDRVIYINNEARNVTKLDQVNFLESHIWDLFPSLIFTGGDRVQTLSANGKTYDVQSYALLDWQNHNRSKVYVLRDISELIEYQYNLEQLVEEKSQELMQTERMAAIGQTTLMVGHDLRNPLQVVKFITHRLRSNHKNDENTLRLLEKIDSNLVYMDKIVSDLSMYAKKSEPNLQNILLIDMIENCLIKLDVPEGVIIDYDFDFEYCFDADPYMIERVFNNLLLNAIQAMPDGGLIRVEAESVDGRNTIRVSDSGFGIQEEIMDDLFKPLNTTKPKGVGMGLAVCKKIVNQHNGEISVDPNYVDGACFVMDLPIN